MVHIPLRRPHSYRRIRHSGGLLHLLLGGQVQLAEEVEPGGQYFGRFDDEVPLLAGLDSLLEIPWRAHLRYPDSRWGEGAYLDLLGAVHCLHANSLGTCARAGEQ